MSLDKTKSTESRPTFNEIFKDPSSTTVEKMETGLPMTNKGIIENKKSDLVEILSIWKNERSEEIKLKKLICKFLISIICVQLIFIIGLIIFVGLGNLNLEEWTFRLIVGTVFVETVAVFSIVVKSLFPEDSSKSMLELIKHIYSTKDT